MNLKLLDTPVHMLDTSHYDGQHEVQGKLRWDPIDWAKAKSKWGAVIIKQGQGLDVDSLFEAQFKAAEGHVWRGLYHYFDAKTNAIASAHSAADAAEKAGGYGELGVFLDIEANPLAEYFADEKKAGKGHGKSVEKKKPPKLHGAEYVAAVASWLFEMDKRMKAFGSDAPLGIYTRVSFWDPLYEDAGSPAWAAKYPVWVAIYPYPHTITYKTAPKDKAEAEERRKAIAEVEAQYAATSRAILDGKLVPNKPAMPRGFKTLLAWQWAEKGRPADIEGYPPYKKSVDFNLLYYGPVAETKATPKGPPEAPPEVAVPLSSEAAIRLDELVRLQGVIENYIKERKQELAAAGTPPIP
jgi:GH25 family lysozyme M1 (1,4-beta-N-acetylmuramidase)